MMLDTIFKIINLLLAISFFLLTWLTFFSDEKKQKKIQKQIIIYEMWKKDMSKEEQEQSKNYINKLISDFQKRRWYEINMSITNVIIFFIVALTLTIIEIAIFFCIYLPAINYQDSNLKSIQYLMIFLFIISIYFWVFAILSLLFHCPKQSTSKQKKNLKTGDKNKINK